MVRLVTGLSLCLLFLLGVVRDPWGLLPALGVVLVLSWAKAFRHDMRFEDLKEAPLPPGCGTGEEWLARLHAWPAADIAAPDRRDPALREARLRLVRYEPCWVPRRLWRRALPLAVPVVSLVRPGVEIAVTERFLAALGEDWEHERPPADRFHRVLAVEPRRFVVGHDDGPRWPLPYPPLARVADFKIRVSAG